MRRLRARAAPAPAGVAALAPFVDLMTILLVFLLRSYSTDPPILPDDPSFALPSSVEEEAVDHATRLIITDEAMFLGKARVAGCRYYVEQDDTLVVELHERLIGAPPPRLQIVADEDTPYVLLRKVLFTAQQAGVQDLTVVAASRASL
ncbi:MAG: biopolymer transporter ExbD [Alphaproteobacteria bacterium]|nr:biopolymer transporter ExbD [Alphaproteobacteria bacterium]